MADFISPIVGILACLCGYCSKRADSIRELGDNLNSLRNNSNRLDSRYRDVERKVDTAEQDPNQEFTVKDEVKNWMREVQALQRQVQDILQQGDQEIQATCFGGQCPKNCRARYKLSKRVTQKLSDIKDLIDEGNFDVVAENSARQRFVKLPVGKTVGLEGTFLELCSCFENNQLGIIGVYGTGGVGKTTLLKKFNNDFLSTKKNYVVIWAVAPKDADPGKIQDVIRRKFHVQDDIWSNKTVNDRAHFLYNILDGKKFVLLLDDVWGKIDLLELGVPSPDDHDCKIIFTTRSLEVCGLMNTQWDIRVNYLPQYEAFKLFKEKVGESTLENPYILRLAKQVVDECGGLPLALCTVASAMPKNVIPTEWSRSIEILRSYPSKVQGMVDKVYPLLEFSYDSLPDASKLCFSYCALFPEDYNISTEELILLWIGEGFLADNNIYEARKKGTDIISSLKYACLLESGDFEGTIKMHDLVREMALWVTCDHGKNSRFFVSALSVTGGHEVYNQAKWEDVERLSMQGRQGETFPEFWQKPHCPKLITLLIRAPGLQVFPTEVFVLPTAIKVLDLSSNKGISNLPSAISGFVNLEYMDLSRTSITKLPEELENLKKLRFFLLDGIERLEFPKGVISGLISLQAFSLRSGLLGSVVDEPVLFNELEVLDHLQVIRISVHSISCVEKILTSSKLQRCMCNLDVFVSSPLYDSLSSLGKMEHLETLFVFGVQFEAANIPMRSSLWGHNQPTIILRELTIGDCHNIIDLNCLIHAPNLETLYLLNCDSLVEVISEDVGTERVESSTLFCNLSCLGLESLSNLKSICTMALRCSYLEEIEVIGCPNLKKLPFNSQSELKNLRRFEGDSREWLDQLEWEDEATKHLFSSKFVRGETLFGFLENIPI